MNIQGLYDLDSKDDTGAIIKLCSKEHPIFKGHFPLNPILPAFIHFEIISDIFSIDIKEIKKAKFSEVIVPDDIVHYKKDKNKFKIFVNNKQVAMISL